MKKYRNRGQANLERVYYGHAHAIMTASALGQPKVFVVGEDHSVNDSALGDLYVYVRDMEYPSKMKTVNGSSNALTDVVGIFSNKAAFGKLHKIIRTKLLKDSTRDTFLCTFLNRIDCFWFAKFEYDSKGQMIRCQVALEIPVEGLRPFAQICPRLDEIIDDYPGEQRCYVGRPVGSRSPIWFQVLDKVHKHFVPHERHANNSCCFHDKWWYILRY